MEHELRLTGLECDSCARVISRVVERLGASVKDIDYSMGRLVVEVSSDAQLSELKATLIESGYGVDGAGTNRGVMARPMALFGKLLSNSADFDAERRIAESSLFSLLIMLVGVFLLTYVLQIVSPRFVPLLAFAAFGTAACSMALVHFRAFKQPFSCMSGMMIGMTIGMMAGFLAGALSGAANGMLVGTVAGIAVGMAVGAVAGSRTGVMGILEGLMAGLMSGTMGAMLSVMLFNDNIVLFLAFLFASCVFILFGLSYMMLREGGNVLPSSVPGVAELMGANVVAFAVFSALLVWGPKAAFAWAGAS